MSEPIVLDTPLLDASNVSLELTSERALVDLIKIVISNENIKNKISIKLTPDMINLINNIIKLSPNSLNDIDNSIKKVIKDGKIDSKDIPTLIVIIQDLYCLIYSIKNVKFDNVKRAEVTSSILKFIIHLLVLEKKIVIEDNKQAEFLADTDVLIDNCVKLLSLSKIIKTKGCFKKLFG